MLFLFQTLNESVGRGAYISPTMDVLLYTLIATALATAAWYFWQKKDKAKIAKLQGTLNTVQPKLEVLHNEHEHLKAENTEVKLGLSEMVTKYQHLQNQHQSFVSSQNTAKAQYEQLDEERQSLLDSYESLESNFNALDLKHNNAVTTLDRLEEEVENLKEERAELKLLNSRLRAEIKKLEILLEGKGVEVAIKEEVKGNNRIDAQDEEDEIERLIGASKAQPLMSTSNSNSEDYAEKIRLEKENLFAVYEALKEDYNQIRNEHTHLTNQYSELQETHNQLVVQKNTTVTTNASVDFKTEKEALLNKLAKIRVDHIQLKKEYAILKDEYDNYTLPKLKDSQTLLAEKEAKLKGLESRLMEQSSKFQTSAGQLKSFENLQATNQALYTNNKVLNDQHLELQQEYQNLQTEFAGLKSQFQLLRERYTTIEKEREHKKSFKPIENPELIQLSKDYGNLKVELLAAHEKHKEQKTKLAEMTQLLAAIKESSSYGIIYLPTNLQIIEGIGPKVEDVLNKANIQTWEAIATSKVDALRVILKEAGRKYALHDPTTWPQQATLLVEGKWKAFRDLEAQLIDKKKAKSAVFDDLKKIEGVGPKIEVLLNNAGINTWKELSKTGIGELRRILKAGGSSYAVHDPRSWPEQAGMAASGDWFSLATLQDELKGGRAVGS